MCWCRHSLHLIGARAAALRHFHNYFSSSLITLHPLTLSISGQTYKRLSWFVTNQNDSDAVVLSVLVVQTSPFTNMPICTATVRSPHVVPLCFRAPFPPPSAAPFFSISSSDQVADSRATEAQTHREGSQDSALKSVATPPWLWFLVILFYMLSKLA